MAQGIDMKKRRLVGYLAGFIAGVSYGTNPLFAKPLLESGVPVLVINSRADLQIFDTDIEQWQEKLSDADNVTIRIYDDLSHFGYRINAADTAQLYRKADFPEELITDFSEFIKAFPLGDGDSEGIG